MHKKHEEHKKSVPTRYDEMFAALAERGEGAYIPFVTLGDPNAEESLKILKVLAQSGADALEVGMPFSDPVADGPVIQSAANRALEAGITPDTCFDIIARFRSDYPRLPIGLLVYANLVVNRGMEDFYERAASAGIDSILVADAPTVEGEKFSACAIRSGVAPVYIAPPNASEGKLREIAEMSRGYTYFLGRSGVTGAETEMKAPQSERVRILKDAGSPPVVVGFGISRPEHVAAAIASGADGAISGSATVALIAAHLRDARLRDDALAAFTQKMKAATKRV